MKKKPLTKRFARNAILVSTLLMILICVFGLVYLKKRPQILDERATKAIQNGDFHQAVELYGKMEKNEETDAKLLAARYGEAEQLLTLGKYEEAEKAFLMLGDYQDSRSRILECQYGQAEAAMKDGRYEEAKERFYALSGYSDALSRYDAARYAIASETEKEDPERAFDLFYDLGGFSDAKVRAEQIAMQITGMASAEDAVNLMLGVSEEEILLRNRIRSRRELLPKHVLAVGFYHTVGLKKDGTVVAAGSNSDGQCNVSKWEHVTAIDCGAYHSVGLLENGTVVATGRNVSGQCNVSEWSNIVAVACTDYNTIGLQADGTIVTTGYQTYNALTGWKGIESIGGGSYIAVAVTENGQLLSSHPSSRSETIRGIVQADASTGYAVCLLESGMVIGTASVLSETDSESELGTLSWKEIISVSASSTGILGLGTDGKVYSHWFRDRDTLDFSDVTNAVAVAAGGTHSAILTENGTVLARGSNESGECETASWNLGTYKMD